MQQVQLPAGAQCLTPEQTWKKLARSKSWGWEKVKNDPDFPKPIYIGTTVRPSAEA